MDSVPRFKTQISNKYVQEMFAKRHPKRRLKQITRNESKVLSVTSIPSEMLPKLKSPAFSPKEYKKPENWIKTQQTVKLSREEVYREEKKSIARKLDGQQGWSRAARSLNTAIKSPANKNNPLDDTSEVDRRVNSKEFLQTFFKMASSIAAESIE